MKRILFYMFLILNFKFYSQIPTWVWEKLAIVNYNSDITADASGNIYVVGSYSTPIAVFGNDTLHKDSANSSYFDFYLVKYDSSGNVVWARGGGGPLSDDARGVTVDVAGNIYMTGQGTDKVNFGTTTLQLTPTNSSSYIAKYSPNGDLIWAKVLSIGASQPNAIITDNAYNFYITGDFIVSPVNFGGHILSNSTSAVKFFLTKFDSSGAAIWAKGGYGNGYNYGLEIAADSFTNVFVTGYYTGSTLNFGGQIISNSGGFDGYIVKYDSTGNVLWVKGLGGPGYDVSTGIASDGKNAYIVGGFSSSSFSMGTYTLTNLGNYDCFTAKYDSAGNVMWAEGNGSTNLDGSEGAVFINGNLYVIGHTDGPVITFGSYSITGCNSYIVKYDSLGVIKWAKGTGGTACDQGYDLAGNLKGDIFVSGNLTPPYVVFDNDTIFSSTNGSYLAKIGETFTTNFNPNKSHQISLYPNPSSGSITVYSHSEFDSISIYNSLGQLVFQTKDKGDHKQIDISKLASGIYILRIDNSYGKFVKE